MKKTFYLLAFIATLFMAPAASAQTAYTIKDLGTLGGSSSTAYGINNLGQVVGYSYVAGDTNARAFVYSDGAMLNLGTVAGSEAWMSVGYAINNAGQVTGLYYKPWYYPQYPVVEAFLYSGGMTDIGVLSTSPPCCSTSMSQGAAINNLGQVTGTSYLNDQSTMGFLYSNGTMTPIGTLYTGPPPDPEAFYWSAPAGINDSSQIVGWSPTTDANTEHAFLWSNGTMHDLGTLGGHESLATAIDNAGQVTGYADLANGNYHAFLYTGGVMEDIGALGGSVSLGYAINNLGQIVGAAATKGNAAMHPFLYTPGKTPETGAMVDLQTLLPSGSKWVLNAYSSMGINDAGQIAISGANPQGQTHALLLTPNSSGITLTATQYGSSGTTIRLQWNYGNNPFAVFQFHRQPPSGTDTEIDVDASVACGGSSADSKCTFYDSTFPNAYGTYSYKLLSGGLPISNTSTAYQLQTYLNPVNSSIIYSVYAPELNKNTRAVHDAAVSLGFDHFNWVQTVTHEPSCNTMHGWNANNGNPIEADVQVAPHLDPPLGGYYESGLWENICGKDFCAGPSDALPYYWDENPNPYLLLPWYMSPAKHSINPKVQLSAEAAGGNQTNHLTAIFVDAPQEPCMPDFLSPAHQASDYMGFTATLVGVYSPLGQAPSTAENLATFVWSSNNNGDQGGATLKNVPGPDTVYSGTGGVFNIALVDANSLPLGVRQLLVDNGVQGVTVLPGAPAIPPMTSAFLNGISGMNGWYTGPVQVTLIATDASGPADIASTTYNLDGAGSEPYSVPFAVTTDGVHSVVYGSTDLAGLAESPQLSSTVKIDQTPPTSHVSALPASESNRSFTVQWSGSDAISGIQNYTIYVSDNGGAFTTWQTNTSSTSATFNGQAGHTYGFYSIAQDMAGNVEGPKSAAEATTTAGGAINVTFQVKVTSTGFLLSRSTKTYNGTVTVSNVGSSPIAGPLQVGFAGLPTGVTLANATTTNGSVPYIALASGLTAGQSTSFTVQFSNPSNASISYSPIVYSGAF